MFSGSHGCLARDPPSPLICYQLTPLPANKGVDGSQLPWVETAVCAAKQPAVIFHLPDKLLPVG